jgi:hypothetical protein
VALRVRPNDFFTTDFERGDVEFFEIFPFFEIFGFEFFSFFGFEKVKV